MIFVKISTFITIITDVRKAKIDKKNLMLSKIHNESKDINHSKVFLFFQSIYRFIFFG